MNETTHPPQEELDALLADRRLLPFLPMVYVAWADGDLTEAEIDNICSSLEEHRGLESPCDSQLASWLDPEHPPSARQLQQIFRRIRELSGQVPEDQRNSLVDLGLEMARIDAREAGEDGESWSNEETRQALAEVQNAMGVAPREAAHLLLSPEERRSAREGMPEPEERPAAFDVDAMTRFLDGAYRETRQEIRDLLVDRPDFRYRDELPRHEYREQVLEWLEVLADAGIGERAYPGVTTEKGSMGSFIATFETLGIFDLNLVVKFGVQFGLFGGSIYFLGTEKHHEKYLSKVASCELPGGYAMSELGHGSNVRAINTTAVYDPETEEFVIDTPSNDARKEWIGNAAAHGRMMTVFVQLETQGEHYGVHAILVPVRDEDGRVLPGVKIADNGHKIGLNGVDNGRIWFDEVRVPRENLLDRFATVHPDGTYESPIASSGKRFFTMLGTLVAGRVSVGAAALSAAKTGLNIAVRYGSLRRQFGPSGEPEVAVLDYLTHQRRLIPRLAKTYAINCGLDYVIDRYVHKSEEDEREVEALAAGFKAYATWHATDTLQTCRECCGGQGYLTNNRIGIIQNDVDIFATFEGDNIVLLQLVAKALLSDFRQQFSDMKIFNILRFVARQASSEIASRNPIETRRTDSDHLRDHSAMFQKIRYREDDLLRSVAGRLRRRIDDGMTAFEALVDCQDHVVHLAESHIERVIAEQFIARVEGCEDDDLRAQLERLCSLYLLHVLEEDMGWFMRQDFIENPQAEAIVAEINALCSEIREQAVPLVDGFGIPDKLVGAPIAFHPLGGLPDTPETSPIQ